ncbi:ABC transporter substrate-binding protein [Nakamurella sp.]|uniref:ABC transporter substrate-binding protein n=1 Tax=Nakamurella sp. TaxID=1869182 RepID=UPI003B3BE1CE
MRKTILTAVAVVVALFTLAACGGGSSGGASSGGSGGSAGTLTIAAVTPPKSFAVGEMATSGPESTYYQAVYDTLFGLDADGKPVANLVTAWSYDPTGTTLSLTLRSDVTFTDGTAFDAAAVKANLEKAKQGTGEAGSALRSVQSVTVVDSTHADVVLGQADPGLIDSLARSSGYMASPATLNNADAATNPVGSGPYTLDQSKSTAGSTYAFARNANYWNKAAYPYDSVEVRYLDDTTAIINGLRSGQIQATAGASTDLVSGAKQADLTVTTYYNGGVEGVWLWDRGGANTPALADERVRQAINYAFDRTTIVDKIKGGMGTPTVQIFGPSSDAYVASLEDSYPYDVAKARSLMAEAGYADGFSMTLPDFSPVYPDEQAAMTEALQALNISITYQPITGDQVVGSIMGGQWPINFFSLTSASPWELSQLTLTPQSPFNPFHTDDATVNGLLDKARTQTGDEQGKTMQELNAYLVDHAWFAPWYSQEGAFITTKNVAVTPVQGVNVPPLANLAPAAG